MGFDDLIGKGQQAYEDNKDKIDEALHSEKAEEISDAGLDFASDAARKVTPDSADEKIDGFRDNLDGKIGNE